MICGFIRRVTDSPYVKALLVNIGLEDVALAGGDFRPGSNVDGLISQRNDETVVEDAIWWFILDSKDGFKPLYSATTFNARDLSLPTWANPIKTNRGIIIADAIGESNHIPGMKKKQYLMESHQGLILGAVYRIWQTTHGPIRSMAVITRPPIPEFSKYHDKSIPLFLPPDRKFLQKWLSPEIETDLEIENLLADPQIFTDLKVTEVKTYKSSVPVGEPEFLLSTA